jgi:adenine deaminase
MNGNISNVVTDNEGSLASRRALIEVALGRREADLYVQNGSLVNVYSGEILAGQDIAISGTRIAYVGPSMGKVKPGAQVIDAGGAHLLPGYIDAHAHVDFFANPLSLTPHLLAGGTTALMADPHEAVGALGLEGLEMLLDMTRGLPLKFYFSSPVATPPLPTLEGAPILSQAEIEACLIRPEIRAISEVTPWVRLISCDADLLSKFELAQRHERRIEGHTTGASYQKLNALTAAGLTSCHEAINAREARERLRLGLYVMLRHGSIRRDLEPLLELMSGNTAVDTRRVLLTPDWMDPPAILEHGYMDSLVTVAIEQGVPPLTAIQMATLNPATYLGLDTGIGGIAPGRIADIHLVDELNRPTPRLVIANGEIVARDGRAILDLPAVPPRALHVSWLPHRILPPTFGVADFQVGAPASVQEVTVPVIAIVDKTITKRQDTALSAQDGYVRLRPHQDVLKIALLNTELPGFMVAFMSGFGAKVGGLASSLAHEPHRPLVIGCEEGDMVLALRRMQELAGGIVLVHEGEVLAEIPLPIGGLMSVDSLEDLTAQIGEMNRVLKCMGCSLENPIFTIGFLTFSALPWLRLTPKGLWDVKKGRIVWPPLDG